MALVAYRLTDLIAKAIPLVEGSGRLVLRHDEVELDLGCSPDPGDISAVAKEAVPLDEIRGDAVDASLEIDRRDQQYVRQCLAHRADRYRDDHA